MAPPRVWRNPYLWAYFPYLRAKTIRLDSDYIPTSLGYIPAVGRPAVGFRLTRAGLS